MMENMMNRLFSHISSDNNTLDQRNNKQATKQQPNLGQGQRNKDYTKTEITLCGACNRNFKPAGGLTQLQNKWTRRENANENYVTVNNITLQPA